MDPSKISLTTPSKSFEYEKMSRDIDKIDDVEVLQNMLKTYIKLILDYIPINQDNFEKKSHCM